MIYRQHPEVGAILHVHAWMEGIAVDRTSTTPAAPTSWPRRSPSLIAREPDPGHAVIGLRNHGLTITGESLDEIFDRIEARSCARCR